MWFTNIIIKYVFNKVVCLVLCCQVVERAFWEKLQPPDLGVESLWSSMKMALIPSDVENVHSSEREQCCCSPFGPKTLQSAFSNCYLFLWVGAQKTSSTSLCSLIFHLEHPGLSPALLFSPGVSSYLFAHRPFHWKWRLETPPSASARELTSQACGGKRPTLRCVPALRAHSLDVVLSWVRPSERALQPASSRPGTESSMAVQRFCSEKLWMNPREISEMSHWPPGSPCLDTEGQATKDLTPWAASLHSCRARGLSEGWQGPHSSVRDKETGPGGTRDTAWGSPSSEPVSPHEILQGRKEGSCSFKGSSRSSHQHGAKAQENVYTSSFSWPVFSSFLSLSLSRHPSPGSRRTRWAPCGLLRAVFSFGELTAHLPMGAQKGRCARW